MQDTPPERAVRDFMPSTPSFWEAVDRGDLAWTTVPGVCPGLAQAMLNTPEVDRLWGVLAPILRLDVPDPQAAWRQHIAGLHRRAKLLQDHRFAGLRFRGGGTDLSVGLLVGAQWVTCSTQTRWGHAVKDPEAEERGPEAHDRDPEIRVGSVVDLGPTRCRTRDVVAEALMSSPPCVLVM
jgi:leucyl aminopeptidase (aminopeptidase T)